MKTILIIGAGEGLSYGVAEKFGKEGYVIGLISRNLEKLNALKQKLNNENIQCFIASANAYDSKELENAILKIKDNVGSIEVLLYNAAALKMKDLMKENSESLVQDFKITVANAFHCVQFLLEDLKSSHGSVLITGGYFAIEPSHKFGSLSIGKAGLRSLAFQLHEELKEFGIFVTTLTINGYIQNSSSTHSPKILAEKFWYLFKEKSEKELVY